MQLPRNFLKGKVFLIMMFKNEELLLQNALLILFSTETSISPHCVKTELELAALKKWEMGHQRAFCSLR